MGAEQKPPLPPAEDDDTEAPLLPQSVSDQAADLVRAGSPRRLVDLKLSHSSESYYLGPSRLTQAELNTRIAAHDLNFTGLDLHGLDMRGLDLRGANFSVADLSGVNLNGANLSGVKMRGVDLTGAQLRGANLAGADLSECPTWRSIDGSKRLQRVWGGAKLRDADLANANLTGANLAAADLSGAIMPKVQHPAPAKPGSP